MRPESRLLKLLENGEFVVTAELGPPRSCDEGLVEKKAALLKGSVDAVNLTDNQTSIVRLSSLAASVLVQQQGLEAILQMTCRDRNRLALQSDLLGAAALGLKNLLCLTGDHQCFGNHPQAKNVFDLDAVQLLSMVKTMCEEGKFLSGEDMKKAPALFLGAAANPFAEPLDLRLMRLEKKIKAGAAFIQTQPVFDLEKFKLWMEKVRERGLHEKAYILAGLMPIRSVKMLNFMRENVPGVVIPEVLSREIEEARDPGEAGINYCSRMIGELKKIKGVAGVHLMAVEWEKAVPEMVSRAGLLPRPG